MQLKWIDNRSDKTLPPLVSEVLTSVCQNKVLYDSKQYRLFKNHKKQLILIYKKQGGKQRQPFKDKDCKFYRLPKLLKEAILEHRNV